MKKLNAIILISALMLAGCKSLPSARKVTSLELLNNNSSFYMKIGSTFDRKVVASFIESKINGLSTSRSRQISSRIDDIYIALDPQNINYELIADVRIPPSSFSRALTSCKKNTYSFCDKSGYYTEYTSYSYGPLVSMSLVNGLFIYGKDTQGALNRYNDIITFSYGEEEALDEEIYDFLESEPSNRISFYARDGSYFLYKLINKTINLPIKEIKGYISPEGDDFSINMDINVKDYRVLKALRATLILFMSLNDSNIQIENNHLLLTHLKITRNQMYNMF